MKNMVLFLTIAIMFSSLVACNTPVKSKPSVPEIEGFEPSVLNELSKYGEKTVLTLSESGFDEINPNYKIAYINIAKEERQKILAVLKTNLKDKGYLVFYSSISYDKTPEKICLMKMTEKYDALRAFKTNGINYDIDTDALIGKLKEWDHELGLEIIGVDGDWVDIKFSNLPNDTEKFANEIYKFCPDSVDQGVGEISELEKLIKSTKEVFLWWD